MLLDICSSIARVGVCCTRPGLRRSALFVVFQFLFQITDDIGRFLNCLVALFQFLDQQTTESEAVLQEVQNRKEAMKKEFKQLAANLTGRRKQFKKS